MTPKNRSRILWTLAAVGLAYALLNAIIFYTTRSFGAVWFATSLLVYGVLIVATILFAILETRARSADVAKAPEPALAREETIYQTGTSRVVRATYTAAPDPRTPPTRYFILSEETAHALHEVEAMLDARPIVARAREITPDVDAALARHAKELPS